MSVAINPKLEEFKALRDEMIFTLNSRVWGNLAYGGLAGGLVAGLYSHAPLLCFTILIYCAIPFLSHNIFRELSRYRIAAYIRKFIEDNDTNICYETRLSYFRKGNKSNIFIRWAFNSSIYGLYLILPSVSLAFLIKQFSFPLKLTLSELYMPFGLIGYLFIISIIFYFEFYSLKSEDWDKQWENAEDSRLKSKTA